MRFLEPSVATNWDAVRLERLRLFPVAAPMLGAVKVLLERV